MLQEADEALPTVTFSFRERDGSVVQQTLTSKELSMEDGVPIGTALMDMLFRILTAEGPAKVTSMPCLRADREGALQWMRSNAPPPEWCGLRMIPLAGPCGWSLLMARYRGPGADV